MTKTLLAVVLFGLTAMGLAGCGGGGDDLVGDTCKKMDECGFLKDINMTVSECKKMGDAEDAKKSSAAQEEAARKCLEKSCDEFMTCVASIPE